MEMMIPSEASIHQFEEGLSAEGGRRIETAAGGCRTGGLK